MAECVKCGKDGEYFGLDAKRAIYCKECFIKMVKHKFDFALGKNRMFKEKEHERTLLIFNGDPASFLLLLLVFRTLHEHPLKRLRIIPTVLIQLSSSSEADIAEQLMKFQRFFVDLSTVECKIYVVHMAAILRNQTELCIYQLNGNAASIAGACEGLNETYKIAASLNCSKVLLPDNAESLSYASLNALCFGQGASISDLTSVVDQRFFDVQFIRPLRDICDKEIRLFHELEGISQPQTLPLDNYETTFHSDVGGIQSLTAKFISDLQFGGYPATIATILSFMSKVVSKAQSNMPKCKLCFASDFGKNQRNFGDKGCCNVCVDLLLELDENSRDTIISVVNHNTNMHVIPL